MAAGPAYDLVFAPGPGGEHSTTVAGEGRAPATSHMLRLASAAGIPDRDAEAILDEVASAVARWRAHARRADVGGESTGAVERAIEPCLARV